MNRLHISLNVEMWVVWVVAVGAIIGLVLPIDIMANPYINLADTKGAISVGVIFWILTGLSVWSYNKVAILPNKGAASRRRAVEIEISKELRQKEVAG